MVTVYPQPNPKSDDFGGYNKPIFEEFDHCGDSIFATLAGPRARFTVTKSDNTIPTVLDNTVTIIGGPLGLPVTIHVNVATLNGVNPLVGHPIMIYSIHQVVQVAYPAGTSNGGHFLDNYPVNRTDFRLVRGVQSEIRFYVRDLDRKPVALGNTETLTINIVDRQTDTILMTRTLSTLDSSKGIYLLTIFPNEMDQWPTTNALRWSIKYNRADSSSVLLWTDRDYSPYSTCTITETPTPAQATSVTINNGDLSQLVTRNYYSQRLVGAAAYAYMNGVQTFTVAMTNYTGVIRIDASLATDPDNTDVSPDWFQVDSQSYTANTGTVVLNEVGNYLWLRVVAIYDIANTGSVDQIVYKG